MLQHKYFSYIYIKYWQFDIKNRNRKLTLFNAYKYDHIESLSWSAC